MGVRMEGGFELPGKARTAVVVRINDADMVEIHIGAENLGLCAMLDRSTARVLLLALGEVFPGEIVTDSPIAARRA